MIINALKQCCYLCSYPDIEVEEQELMPEKINAYIYCSHEKVCKYYNGSEEEKNESK